MNMYRKPATKLAFFALGAIAILSACSTTALPPGKSIINTSSAIEPSANTYVQQAAFPAHPSGFEWAGQTLKASGQGAVPEGMPAAQAEMTARNSARIGALTNLKTQVRALPVGTDQTVGSISDSYITIRHAVEQEIVRAQDDGSSSLAQGGIEMQVQLPLQNIANILQQYQITPDQELPETGNAATGVPNII